VTLKNVPKAGCYPEKCPVSRLDKISGNREGKAEQTFRCGCKTIINIFSVFKEARKNHYIFSLISKSALKFKNHAIHVSNAY
jgi:hypothetical protein